VITAAVPLTSKIVSIGVVELRNRVLIATIMMDLVGWQMVHLKINVSAAGRDVKRRRTHVVMGSLVRQIRIII